MFQVVKQGDTYRLLYSAKDFRTGLTDVQAVPYNPSGTPQTAVGMTEISTSGIYYADFSTSAKTLGAWGFKIDSATKSSPAYTRIQIVDGDTLNDTIFEKMDTMLDSLLTNVATIDGKVDIIDGNVDDIEGEVKSGTYGLSALKTILDTIQNTMNSIQNNADAKVALPEAMLIPGTGTTTYKVYVNVYDSTGNMEDPDDQDPSGSNAYVAVSVANMSGTDRSANLGGLDASTFESKKWLTRVSEGRYSCTYAVANTHAIEELIFTFNYEDGGTLQVDKSVARADNAGDLNNTFYWIFTEAKSYYIWYNVNSGGVDPDPTVPSGAPATKVGIAVAIATGASDTTVGGNTRTALSAATEKTVSGSGADIIVTHKSPYDIRNSEDGAGGGATTFTITTLTEGAEGKYKIVDRATETSSSASDYGSRFDSIDSALVTANGNITDIETIVAHATYGNAALQTLIAAIQTDLDNGTDGLGAIKSAVDGNYSLLTNATYGLSALKAILDTITGYVDGVETGITDIKGTSWAAADNLHNIAEAVKPGGIALGWLMVIGTTILLHGQAITQFFC